MIKLASKIFINDYKNYTSPSVRRAYGTLAGVVGIILNFLLFSGKLAAGIMSKSVSITADALNNLSDAGSSAITLIGFRLSAHKPDREHPFGHGRMEYISGLLVAVVILIMGFELIRASAAKIIHPTPVSGSAAVFVILAVSVAVKLYMFLYNRALSKKIDSTAMKATALDSICDAAATALVLAAAVVGKYTGLMLDGWLGIAVGLFIMYSGGAELKETIDLLLGSPPKKELTDRIAKIVLSHSMIRGCHDLTVHDYGPGRVMISLHAEVDANGDLRVIHEKIDHIESELQEKLHCSATIHIDPIITDDKEVLAMRDRVEMLMRDIDADLKLSDFRMVKGPTRTSLIFNIHIPKNAPLTDNRIVNLLKKRIFELGGGRYFAVIRVEHEYC